MTRGAGRTRVRTKATKTAAVEVFTHGARRFGVDLVEAAATGSRLSALESLRDVLAVSIGEAEPDKRAPLVARMTDVLEQIERLRPAEKVGDPVDEIAKRRATRGAGSAKSSSRPAANPG